MNITKHQVHPALKEFIDAIFSMSRDAHEEGTFFQTALPNYECFLSFELETDFLVKKGDSKNFVPLYSTTVIPPQFIKSEIKGKSIKAILVKFKNGGFFRLFKVPIPNFNNSCYNARDIFDKDFSEILAKIMEFESLESRIKVVEGFLLKKVRGCKPTISLDFLVDKLALNHGNTPILELASHACMSVRQLQRKFIERYGISPKHYSKFIRYTEACQIKTRNPQLTWGEISLRCGYFDQMHLIHDFKSITGQTPYELFLEPPNSRTLTLVDK